MLFCCRLGIDSPTYINQIRDPLEKMASQYYYIRFGHKRNMSDTARHRVSEFTDIEPVAKYIVSYVP